MPETLVSGWTEGSGHGNRVLEGYLGILNAGTKFSETEGEFTFSYRHWTNLMVLNQDQYKQLRLPV